MVTAGSELTPGTSVDRRYLIQCTLGRGGFGRTYLAADERRFNELCVLKEFVPNSQADVVVAQKLHELFQREAAILHQLDHPQIPKFFAGFEENGRLFIAQEYIDGKTYWRLLQERQRRGQAFSQPEMIKWLWDLLKVLDYLHQKNIVHRDISPDNIMLPRGGRTPVLIDFGVVKQTLPHLRANPADPDGLIQASVAVGKFGYAPYEQIRVGQCSPRSDLYALAVTAVVLLTGKPPNLLMDAKSLEWQWQRQVQIDPHLVQILNIMMADRPQDRFGSATEVLQELQALYKTLAAMPPAIASRARQRVKAEANSLPESILARATPDLALPSLTPSEPDFGPEWMTHPTWINGQPASVRLDTQLDGRLEIANASAIETLPDDADLPAQSITYLEGLGQPDQIYSDQIYSDQIDVDDVDDQHKAQADTQIVSTQIAAGIVPVSSSEWDAPVTLLPRLSPRSLLDLVRAAVLRQPSDRLGNARRLNFSLKQAILLAMLASLPIGGAVVGIRSPHISSICATLGNCIGQSAEERYQQAIAQADSASVLSDNARSLNDLQQARQRLSDSIAQLNTFSGNFKFSSAAHRILPRYQALLQTLDAALEIETRAAQLLHRAEAEAQRATERTKVAKTYQHFQTAQTEWRRALATLDAVPNDTFVSRQAKALIQEYKARLGAVDVKVTAMTPKMPAQAASAAKSLQDVTVPAHSTQQAQPVRSSQIAQAIKPAVPQYQPQPPASRPSPSRSSKSAKAPSQAGTAQRSAPTSQTRTAAQPQSPSTSPLEVDREWVAGNVITSATQTLSNVSIWIDGSRTESDGRFVANLWIQNRSGRGFGFVPLYAESRDGSGQTVRSRVLFTGTADMLLEPGEALNGQIYLLDRPNVSVTKLTLIVQESTNGNRTFRIPF